MKKPSRINRNRRPKIITGLKEEITRIRIESLVHILEGYMLAVILLVTFCVLTKIPSIKIEGGTAI